MINVHKFYNLIVCSSKKQTAGGIIKIVISGGFLSK